MLACWEQEGDDFRDIDAGQEAKGYRLCTNVTEGAAMSVGVESHRRGEGEYPDGRLDELPVRGPTGPRHRNAFRFYVLPMRDMYLCL